jgi:hypothetical protein
MDQVVLSVSVKPPMASGVELQLCLAEEEKVSLGQRNDSDDLSDALADIRSADEMSSCGEFSMARPTQAARSSDRLSTCAIDTETRSRMISGVFLISKLLILQAAGANITGSEIRSIPIT